MQRKDGSKGQSELPDWFRPVAEDVFEYCRPEQGLWVDLGSGSGGLGLALARASGSTVLLIDPSPNALSKGFEDARGSGLTGRVVGIVGRAESIPLPDGSVDVVASRGSVFFWEDPPKGLREVYRILRPGARAMIGGGFGSSYPGWALRQFFRRRRQQLKSEGEEALRRWKEPRRAEWLAAQAARAGLDDALVEPAPPGLWLLFEKGKA